MHDRIPLVDRVIQRLYRSDEIETYGKGIDNDEDDLCDVCQRLNFKSIFNSNRILSDNSIRCVQEVEMREEQRCPFCRLTFRRLPQVPFARYSNIHVTGPKTVNVEICAQRGHLQILYGGQNRGSVRKASFVGPNDLRRDPASTLNCALIKSWLGDCETKHGDSCNLREFSTSHYRFPTDLILIDTIDCRLVKGQSDMRYTALSYVWGGVQMLATTTKNFHSLQQEGALSFDREDLSKVVQDAMRLTYMLGERYLWVDCLCIEQDSPQKHHDIARMDVIYTHAHLVIVAVDGKDANSFLPGVRPWSRSPVRPIIPIRGQLLTSEPPTLDSVLGASAYDTRGWTFQERVLARRRLYISEQQIYFQCNVSIRSETQPAGHDIGNSAVRQINDLRIQGSLGLDPQLSELLSPGSMKRYWTTGLPIYQRLVEIYSSRNLSYSEDILNAFSGFSSVFAECCGGIFLSGLPTAALSASLLWTTEGPLSRRTASSGPSFPSWSWAGWIGTIKYSTGSGLRTFESSDNLGLEIEMLEIFQKETCIDSVAKKVREEELTIKSDVGVIRDCSLHDSPYIPLRHLSMLHSSETSNPQGKPLLAVDALRFTAYTAQADLLRISTTCSKDGIVNILSRSSSKIYGLLFGVQNTDLVPAHGEMRYLISLSSDKDGGNLGKLVKLRGGKYPENHRFIINVMLVRRVGAYVERIAIGKMFSGCWDAVKKADTTTFILI